METVLTGILEYKEILIALVAGGPLLPIVARLLVKTMTLPGVRSVIGKGCEWGGVWVSMVLIKVFRRDGKSVEDEFEDLLQTVIVKRFLAGLNKDD